MILIGPPKKGTTILGNLHILPEFTTNCVRSPQKIIINLPYKDNVGLMLFFWGAEANSSLWFIRHPHLLGPRGAQG